MYKNVVGFQGGPAKGSTHCVNVLNKSFPNHSSNLYYYPMTSEMLVQTFAVECQYNSFPDVKDIFLSKCEMKCKVSILNDNFLLYSHCNLPKQMLFIYERKKHLEFEKKEAQ